MEKKDYNISAVPVIYLKLPRKISFILLGIVVLSTLAVINSYFYDCKGMILQALLVNFNFLEGLTIGTYVFAMLFLLAGVKWGLPFKRLAESALILMPVVLIMLMILLWFDYQGIRLQQHRMTDNFLNIWFSRTILGVRNILLFGGFFFFAAIYSHCSCYLDIYLQKDRPQNRYYRFYKFIVQNKILALLLIFLFILISLNGVVDWMVAIDFSWYSLLLGFQLPVSNLLSGGAVLIIFSCFLKLKLKIDYYFSMAYFDKLIKTTCLLGIIWGGTVFIEIVIIWINNFGSTTSQILNCFIDYPWFIVSIIIFCLLFLLPLIGMMSQKTEQRLQHYKKLAYLILVGVWLEKYLLVVPGLKTNQVFLKLAGVQTERTGYLIMEILVTLGLVALIVFLVFTYFRRSTVFELSNPILLKLSEKESK